MAGAEYQQQRPVSLCQSLQTPKRYLALQSACGRGNDQRTLLFLRCNLVDSFFDRARCPDQGYRAAAVRIVGQPRVLPECEDLAQQFLLAVVGMDDVVLADPVGLGGSGDVVDVQVRQRSRDGLSGLVGNRMVRQRQIDAAQLFRFRSGRRVRVSLADCSSAHSAIFL